MITIVDYGLGNIRAFVNLYKQLGIPVMLAHTSEDLSSATRLILPGVGAFDQAMKRLSDSGMRERIDELVLVKKIPVLGVCVGMQMLGNSSEEGELPGLGWIPGTVRRMEGALFGPNTYLPHMGWNDVEVVGNRCLFNDVGSDMRFYFLHSYYFEADNVEDISARAEYGVKFTCAVQHQNVFGVQFHPEKSHRWGVQLLGNFATMQLC